MSPQEVARLVGHATPAEREAALWEAHHKLQQQFISLQDQLSETLALLGKAFNQIEALSRRVRP